MRAIVEAPQCFRAVNDLDREGHTVETLSELWVSGWTDLWIHSASGAPLAFGSWVITPWAAAELGLVLVEARGIPFWAPAEDLHPLVARRARKEHRLQFPDLLPQPKNAKKKAAQYIESIFYREKTDDPSRAERILGAPVELDERL